MKIRPFPTAVAMLLCLSMLTGCMNNTPGSKNTESANKAENSFDIDGVKLKNESVELTLAPGADGIQGIEDFFITNTKQIVVSTDASLDDAIIEVFLYSAESKDEPIAFAKISSEKKKVVFANLTSSAAYKVAACGSGTSDAIVLIITE